MTNVRADLSAARVVAVLRGPTRDSTIRAVHALVDGGVTAIEITFSTPDAVGVISHLREHYADEIILGAGTVLNATEARLAQKAGASFLVSPGTSPELAEAMTSTGLTTLMGAYTASEVVNALAWGADIVKLFPASLGGPALLKALRGPFPSVAFCPTGGVGPTTIPAWFAAGALAVGGGSELCANADIAEGNWSNISAKAVDFMRAARI